MSVDILTGAGGTFCAGAGNCSLYILLTRDLKGLLGPDGKVASTANTLNMEDMNGEGPMGYLLVLEVPIN